MKRGIADFERPAGDGQPGQVRIDQSAKGPEVGAEREADARVAGPVDRQLVGLAGRLGSLDSSADKYRTGGTARDKPIPPGKINSTIRSSPPSVRASGIERPKSTANARH